MSNYNLTISKAASYLYMYVHVCMSAAVCLLYIIYPQNFVILLRENGLIFLHTYFYNGSIYMRRVSKCMVDGRSAS